MLITASHSASRAQAVWRAERAAAARASSSFQRSSWTLLLCPLAGSLSGSGSPRAPSQLPLLYVRFCLPNRYFGRQTWVGLSRFCCLSSVLDLRREYRTDWTFKVSKQHRANVKLRLRHSKVTLKVWFHTFNSTWKHPSHTRVHCKNGF